MSLHRHVLSALVLFAGGALLAPVVSPAEAASIRNLKANGNKRYVYAELTLYNYDPSNQGGSVELSIKSDAGDEDVTLVESDAWLHGAAPLKALPKTNATLTLTLYDSASASLMSFSGTLGTDGTVSLKADATKDTGGGTCDASTKTGCSDDTTATSLDIEVLAGEVFAASGGYELGLDLAGADTYAVAYAEIAVTESTEVTTCSKAGGCTTTGSSTTTKAEVGWDAIGAVWEGDLSLVPEGVIDVKVKAYDAKGEELESSKVALGVPWLDGGEGINVLATDEDPLTGVGILGQRIDVLRDGTIVWVSSRVAVTSEGWTTTTVPVSAKVELTNGGTITIPVNSYQRGRRPAEFYSGPDFPPIQVPILLKPGATVSITGGSITFADDSVLSLIDTPVCASGGCFMLVENEDGDYDLSVGVYGSDATKLPDDLDLTLTITDGTGAKVYSESETVEFDDDVTAVFANEISFASDPLGLDLAGKVSLLGAADRKGKQATLAKGKFYGSFSRDGDGDLEFAGADKDAVTSNGNIVVAGGPVAFELTTDTNKDGVLNGPPIVAMYGDIILGGMILDDFND